MRQAQTEYESCVDVYQLRIKTLNKVKSPEWSLETVRWVTTWQGAPLAVFPCYGYHIREHLALAFSVEICKLFKPRLHSVNFPQQQL